MITCIISLERPGALDSYKNCDKLGRFTLRDEGSTIGIGRVLELPK